MFERVSLSRLLAFALSIISTTAPVLGADDQCAAILKDGVHNINQSTRTVVVENTTKRYICTHKGQSLTEERALGLGFMIRFLGFRIDVAKDVVKDWIDAKCSDNSSSDRQSIHETTYSRSADKALAEAWLRCKTLQFGSGGVGLTEEVKASDRAGRAYSFRIAVVGVPYYWEKGSSSIVMHQGKAFDVFAQLRSREWLDAIGQAKDVLTVGTASCGGSKDKEVSRGLARANQLRQWIDAAYGRSVAKGTINLGKYLDEFCAEGSAVSDMQRPIMVLLVTEKPTQVLRAIDYQSALMDAATAHPAFQFERYTNFDIALR